MRRGSRRSVRLDVLCAMLLMTSAISAVAQPSDNLNRRFDEAERQIVRLTPTAFPDLPAGVVRELERRGCTIPQEASSRRPNNIIKGEFARRGQTDWAVLCSVNGISTILVFWRGVGVSPAVLAPVEDRHYLQTITETEIGYSRGISVVGREYILQNHRAFGGPTPPPINHHGIDDAFVGKASVTWYFYGSKWLSLCGAD
jgi:hypothetical protein